mgnify:FL=1
MKNLKKHLKGLTSIEIVLLFAMFLYGTILIFTIAQWV